MRAFDEIQKLTRIEASDLERLARADQAFIKYQVERYVEARNSGDLASLDQILSLDVRFEMVGPEKAFPCFGRWRGLQAYKNVLNFLNSQFERMNPEITHLQVNGNNVVFRRTVVARHWAMGAVERLNACCLLTFRDGLVAEFVEYNDTEALVRVLRGN